MIIAIESKLDLELAFEYLNAHEDSAQFLINNLKAHGPRLTEHPNSGNRADMEGI